ncbi:hypothetical protein LZ575_04330 [Antarcticibacterium sp. 1MA-6-2]|uniref:HYC_CC_PP family protein n=1 Tax=Antarcticibacterium sp. 1MA-6-2 TaxID=2908210 RepID=UPI001F24ED7B|nr:hypothetical protein [Antarcticibacterium sp. 1MA-6-2]UJH91883.1 hypothetical protein LZ575_04330 [Antarcticibacterium sp. 1MA-6-2]
MKLLSILLSLIVLFATSSITVDMHYCSDKLVDFAFNQKSKSCNGEIKIEKFAEDTCCFGVSIRKAAQKDLKISSLSFEITAGFGIIPFSPLFGTPILPGKYVPSIRHIPPLVKKDYQVLFEVFLI